MNYFEKKEYIISFLGQELFAECTLTAKLCYDYTERLVLNNYQEMTLLKQHPHLTCFHGYRNWRNPKYIYDTLSYCRPVSKCQYESEPDAILVSFSMQKRFPLLLDRIVSRWPVYMTLNRLNSRLARKSKVCFIRNENVIYSEDIIRLLKKVNVRLFHSFQAKERFFDDTTAEVAKKLEVCLVVAVDKLARIFKKYNIRQYVSAFGNRYDDIFNIEACKKIGAVTKEICHGINSHNLQQSDNVVPTNSEFLYVWSKQFYDNISSFPDMNRVKIFGYPKYDQKDIAAFQKRYPEKKIITFFSQAIWDVGACTCQPITQDLIRAEKKLRNGLIEQLTKLFSQGYLIRYRYHSGEKRTDERRKILNKGFEISNNSFEQDVFESEICIGINTSCLYESHLMGKRTYQLGFDHCGNNHFNCIDIVNIDDLVQKINSNHNANACKHPIMDLDQFISDERKNN